MHEGAANLPEPARLETQRLQHLGLQPVAPATLDVESAVLDPYRVWVVDALTAVIQGLQSLGAEIPR